jgi:hypothetical protein
VSFPPSSRTKISQVSAASSSAFAFGSSATVLRHGSHTVHALSTPFIRCLLLTDEATYCVYVLQVLRNMLALINAQLLPFLSRALAASNPFEHMPWDALNPLTAASSAHKQAMAHALALSTSMQNATGNGSGVEAQVFGGLVDRAREAAERALREAEEAARRVADAARREVEEAERRAREAAQQALQAAQAIGEAVRRTVRLSSTEQCLPSSLSVALPPSLSRVLH